MVRCDHISGCGFAVNYALMLITGPIYVKAGKAWVNTAELIHEQKRRQVLARRRLLLLFKCGRCKNVSFCCDATHSVVGQAPLVIIV